jgi:hypothetical protein
VLSGFTSVSLATPYTWGLTTDGNWNSAGNWDPAGVPNAADAFVTIDNKPSFNVNVTINNFHPSVGGLTIDSGDSVTVSDGHHLYLKNTPTVTNNGTINLTSANSYLTAYNSVATLTGSGSVVLGGSLGNRLRQDYSGSFINDTLHTIKGGGTIEAPVTNKGTILATSAAAPLMITSNITNTGVLAAQGGLDRVLDLRSTITGGQIKPQDGTVELRGADLRGVTLTAGAVNVEQHSDLLGVTSSAANITVKNGVHLFLKADGPTLPNLTNNGTITLTGANSYLTAYNVEATLAGAGEVVLGGSAGNKIRQDYGGSLVNDTLHTIRGGGAIEGITVTNKGKIIADHATTALTIASSTINNATGLLEAKDGSTLAIQSSTINGGQIVPGNTVSLYGAYLYGISIGKGVVNVTGHSWLRANNTLGPETTVNVQDGQHLFLHNEILTNNGTINLTGANSYLTSYNFASTLTGAGEVVLGGQPGNKIRQDYGGTLTNDTLHTIRGGGAIEGITVANKGKIISDNGTLKILSSTINNEGLLQALDGNTLAIQSSTINGGQIVPGNTVSLNDAYLYGTNIGKGVVNVTGHSWLRANNTLGPETTVNVQDGQHLFLHNEILTNNGTINLTGTNSYLTSYNFTSTLTGTGQLVLGGKPGNRIREDYGGTLINDTNHTIRGGGTIDAPVTNKGTVIADNGTLQINRDITGDGSVRVASTGALDLNANLTTGNFTMDNNALLNVANNKYIDLKGNFLFFQTHGQEGNWQWGANSYLSMTGLGAREQRLEVGGKDGGGFDNNFDLNKLSLSGANTYAFLTDWINNGNRSSDECLYVDDLYVEAGSTLNLNHLHLYLKGYGLVTPTADWFNGHGRIIDDYKPVPLPSTLLMLGSALLGLAGLRRKFGKQ